MSDDPVAVARRWADAIKRKDLAEDLWHPDAEIVNAEGWALEATYRGHDGLRRWWRDLEEAFSDFRMEVDEITAVDEEHVLTAQRFVGTFRATGIPWEAPWASILTIRDGRLARAVGYMSKRRALRALEEEG